MNVLWADAAPASRTRDAMSVVTLAAGSAFRAVILLQTTSFVRQRRP